MRKGWVFGLVAGLVLTAMAVPAAGANGSVKDAKTRGRVVGSTIVELKPAAGSKTFPGRLMAKGLDNGEYVVHGEGHFQFGDSPISYHIKVDRTKGTYELTDRPAPKGQSPKVTLHGKASRNGILASTDVTAAGYGTSGSGGLAGQSADVILITQDPPQIDLARTEDHMQWNVDNYGISEWWSSWACIPHWGDGYPYPTDTHWYNDTCSMMDPYLDSQGILQNDLWATYHNYDWADDSLITNAEHSILIHADYGGFDWDFYHTVSGESDYLLDADFWVNGVQYQ